MGRFVTGVAVGVVAAVTLTGTAYAATGGTFVLGRNNSASSQTLLTSSGSGPVLALSTRTGQVPLAVSPQSGKATNLNADKLDGLDQSALQRRVSRVCPDGTAMTVIGASGDVRCEGTLYDYVAEQLVTDELGVAAVACPGGGGIATTGTWTLPEGTVAVANGQATYIADDGSEGYNVRMVNVDGTPYVGEIELGVQCEYPGQSVTAGSLRLADETPAKGRRY